MNKIAVLAAATLLAVGCQNVESPVMKDRGMTNLTINLTDAPGEYDQVNVDVEQVRVQLSDSTWRDLNTNAGIYDLLVLQNGVDTVIVSDSLSQGVFITQLRLILGDDNTVMVDSTLYPLKVPSGSQSGFKVFFHQAVSSDSLNITLDFDAEKSVHELDSKGEYILKPVLHVK